MGHLNVSRRALLTATALGAATAATARPALATPRGRRTGRAGTIRTTATAADVTAVPLGDPDGLYMTRARVINRQGDAIGSGSTHASGDMVWTGGELRAAPLPETAYASLEDINDSGQFVGSYSRTIDYRRYAAVWPDGVHGEALLIHPGDAFRDSHAYRVNNSGQVTYTAMEEGSDVHRTFLYDLRDGSRTEVRPPSGYAEGAAPLDLNDNGQLICTSRGLDFFWENGVATPLVAASLGRLRHLNQAGHMLAEQGPNDGPVWGAYVWQDGTFTEIPTLGGETLDLSPGRQPMNDLGHVIGVSDTADGRAPFVYSEGRTTALPTDAGGVALPRGLNNGGLIVGEYRPPEDLSLERVGLWQDGAFTDLGTVQGYSHTVGLLVSEQGLIFAAASQGYVGSGVGFQLTVD
jgi:uncharacterized membrane protein